ncbi:Fc.00g081880.m01.CDS01 [Cosmosporella sp. VM-42]
MDNTFDGLLDQWFHTSEGASNAMEDSAKATDVPMDVCSLSKDLATEPHTSSETYPFEISALHHLTPQTFQRRLGRQRFAHKTRMLQTLASRLEKLEGAVVDGNTELRELKFNTEMALPKLLGMPEDLRYLVEGLRTGFKVFTRAWSTIS